MIRPLLICALGLCGVATASVAGAAEPGQDACSYTERHVWVATYVQVWPDGTRSEVPGHWVITRTPVYEEAPVRTEESVRVVYAEPEPAPRVVYVDPPPVYQAPECEPSRVVIRVGDDDWRERHGGRERERDDDGWRERGGERRDGRYEHHEEHHAFVPVVPLFLPPLPLPPLPFFHHHH